MQNSIDLILDRLTLHFVADPPNFQFKAIVFISRLHPVATILKQLLLVYLAVQVNDIVSISDEFQFWFDITDIILDNFFKCQVLKFISVATLDLFCFYYVMKNYRGLWLISARLLVTTILKSPQRLPSSKFTSLVNLLATENWTFWTVEDGYSAVMKWEMIIHQMMSWNLYLLARADLIHSNQVCGTVVWSGAHFLLDFFVLCWLTAQRPHIFQLINLIIISTQL